MKPLKGWKKSRGKMNPKFEDLMNQSAQVFFNWLASIVELIGPKGVSFFFAIGLWTTLYHTTTLIFRLYERWTTRKTQG